MTTSTSTSTLSPGGGLVPAPAWPLENPVPPALPCRRAHLKLQKRDIEEFVKVL